MKIQLLLLEALILCGSANTTLAEELSARGVVRSLAEATIAMDYSARIENLPILDGQEFKQGDVLVSFDCKRFKAEAAAAAANAKAQELVYSNNRRLLDRGAIGSNEVRISQAQFNKAEAESLAVQARVGSCDYKAPFDGRMVQRFAQEQESPAANAPLIKIVDTGRLEVELIIPSKWLVWFKAGQDFAFKIDETGGSIQAKILRLGSTVDPVSQTARAFASLSGDTATVLPGMSGTAVFSSPGS